MKVATKTDKQLVEELEATRSRIAELEEVETQRKQAEEALKQSNRRFRDIAKNALEWIWEVDAEGKYTYTNPVVEKILGYKPSEVLGKHFYDLFHPDDREELKKAAFAVIAKKQPFRRFVNRNIHKNGEIVWLSTSGVPILDKEGNLLGYRGADVDITERKQAEEALQDEKNKLQSVINSLEYGLTIQDKDYNIIYQNELVRRLFGDRLGEKCYRVYEGREKLCDGCPVKKAFKDGKSHTSERRVVLPSGEVTFWENTASPIRDAKGEIVSCLEITRNITERKQAEEALADEATRRRLLVEQSLDGIVVLDENAKVYEANQRFAEMLGYTLEEVRELHTWDWDKNFPPEQLLEMGRNVDETGLHLETQHHRKDDTVIDVDISINGAVVAGQKLIFCVCRDITERKQAEETLQVEKNKLQSVINAMEDGLTIQDKDYNIIYQNELVRRLFGDRLGEKCYQVYEGREELCDGCPVKKAFKDGKSHTSERRVVLPSGEVTFWENTANPIRDAKGKIVSCLEINRNITERKKQEQALSDEATRRRILVEQSRDGIVVLDEKGKVYEANQRFAEMLGYTPEEVRKLNVWDWEAEFPRERVAEMIASVGPEGDNFETRHRRKDGTLYDVEISTNGAVIAGQKLIFCVCRDITERKRAEEELQVEKNKLQSVINAMEDGLTIQDKDYNIIYQNELVRELFGDRLGEKCYRVYEGREKLCDGCPVKKAFKDGKSHTSERRVVLPSGEVTFWENTANPIRDARGKIVSCLEVTRNITERKQAEETLRHSEEKLQKMFESVTDGISVIDLNGVITEVNREAVRMHGFSSRDELVGKSALELVAPRDHEKVATNMRKALKKGTIKSVEYTLLRADGSEFPGELSTSALKDAAGNWVGHVTISRDITERKQGEQALKEAEEKYKNLVESVSDMIWETDEAGTFTFVSPRIKDTLGYEVDEVVGKRRTLDFTPKGEAQKWLARFKKITANRKSFSGFEITHIHKNGNPVIFEISGTPFFDSAGDFKGFVGIDKDITERKQAEQEIERQKAYFQQLFDNSPEGIALLDEAESFVKVNRGFEALFGYRSEELEGRFISEVIVPEGYAEEASVLPRAALDNQVRRKETVRKRKDGSLVAVDVISYPIQFDNQTVGVYVIYSDITERKQAEQALKESQEFSSSLLENSPNPVFVVNPDTSVKYANPAFEKLTGFTLDEITGIKAPYPWWLKEEREEMTASFKNAMVTGGRRSERVFRKKNGERLWVALNSAPVMHEDKLIYFLVSWLDITERKQAEEERMELERKAHLASRLASVGEMASGIAHEINNPMTAVIGFSQLLMDSDLPDDIKEDITVIHKEAQRAANVARNLLAFARKHTPTKQLTNINSIIEGVLKLRAYEQSVSNIRVNTRFASDLPEVMADNSQLQQVFINIILNAEGAMLGASNGGTLTVTTQRVDDTVRASFTDSGPGIGKENLNRIFDPFFTTKEVGKGTGLGLSVCHGILAEHGGRIYARSKSGQGATFVVELPINSRSNDGRN